MRVIALFDVINGLEHETSDADFMCYFEMLVFLQQHKIVLNKQDFIF